MPTEISSFERSAYEIVRQTFVDTADDNYVVARWCFRNSLNVDFKWLAVHALEKYMKAALVLNGVPVKGLGHDVREIYDKLERIAGDLLPKLLAKPERASAVFWKEETPRRFLERLYQDGNADNRYMLFGYVRYVEDIFKLDRTVFSVRRLCEYLDKYYYPPHVRAPVKIREGDGVLCSYRDVLRTDLHYWGSDAGGRLVDIISGKEGEYLRNILLDWNLPFAPSDFLHSRKGMRIAAHNSALQQFIFGAMECGGEEERAIALQLRDWLIQNVKLPGEIIKELRDVENLKGPPPLPQFPD